MKHPSTPTTHILPTNEAPHLRPQHIYYLLMKHPSTPTTHILPTNEAPSTPTTHVLPTNEAPIYAHNTYITC